MNEHSIALLVERVDRLEQENLNLKRHIHRWKRIGLPMAVAAAIILLIGASKHDDKGEGDVVAGSVVAKSFLLQDKEGRLRAALTALDSDPCLYFYNREGVGTLVIGNDKHDAPGIALYNMKGKPRASLVVSPDGDASLGLYGTDSAQRIIMGVGRNKPTTFDIYDDKHDVVFHAPRP